ncbi:ankyrin repeat and SOCS box protein 2-like [Pistacia vera]|uniref:ankyrin repeat and SOCS box protein 2-like n=1 Tax=Pistacia vera TaxID=55513 RepID=UPI001263992E|nr:ankyrin repeat and SOCS box protein 2-like [Pistacia vera]
MTTGNESTFRTYQAALEEDWTFFKQKSSTLPLPLTAARDTAFHLAVCSNSKKWLDLLLHIAENDPMTMSTVWNKNEYRDTPLHVAATNGNLEAVKLLVEYDKDLSHDINDKGEIPLFKAAAYGTTKVVKYLLRIETQSKRY